MNNINFFVKINMTFVLMLILSVLGCGQKKKKPNFVFFLVDDMGWMDIGANGSTFYETPNIDRLASEGVRFTQAYTASPVCSPTRASVLTGKHPARISLTQYIGGPAGPVQYIRNLPLEEVLFTEVLRDTGYTNIFLGKWHLNNREGEGKYWPENQGFDINIAGHWRGGLYLPNEFFSPWNIPNIEDGPEGEYMTDRLAQEAVNFIDNNASDPFLCTFHSIRCMHLSVRLRNALNLMKRKWKSLA
jgi:arylsulfatase A-like enzyme